VWRCGEERNPTGCGMGTPHGDGTLPLLCVTGWHTNNVCLSLTSQNDCCVRLVFASCCMTREKILT
jgi:hypothetical protein